MHILSIIFDKTNHIFKYFLKVVIVTMYILSCLLIGCTMDFPQNMHSFDLCGGVERPASVTITIVVVLTQTIMLCCFHLVVELLVVHISSSTAA